MTKAIVNRTISICDINIMPEGCHNRYTPLWSSNRTDFLFSNGILHCGLGENVAGYEFARKDPEFHLAIFTRKGNGVCRDNTGRISKIGQGDVVVLPAHQPHHYSITGSRWDHFWFHFSDTEAWSFLRLPEIAVRKATYPEEIEKLLVCYHNEAVRDTAQSGDALWHIGESIVHYLRRELAAENSTASETDARLNLLMQEMRSEPGRKWSLAEISKTLCFSRIHAIRLFKTKTGQTPFEYLTRCRMETAAHLLSFTSDKIHAIADRVGYTDQFAFSTAFSRYHKVSPRDFRKRK